MKTTIMETKRFEKALALAAKLAPAKAPMPALQQVMIAAKGDTASVMSTDLTTYYTGNVPTDTAEDGAVAVNAKAFLAVIKKVAVAPLVLETVSGPDGAKLEVRAGARKLKVGTFPIEDLPTYPAPADTAVLCVKSEAQRVWEFVESAVYAADDYRNHIKVLRIEYRAGAIKLVATDGHRLHLGHVAAVYTADASTLCTSHIPGATAAFILAAMKAANGTASSCSVGADTKTECFTLRCGDHTVTAKQNEYGDFPAYDRVVPTQSDAVYCDVDALCEALNLCSAVANGETPLTNLNPKTETQELEVEAASYETAVSEMLPAESAPGVEWSQEESFNARYLLDALKPLSGRVRLGFTGKISPLLIQQNGDDAAELLAVVMPARR